MKRFCFYVILPILAVFLSMYSLYAQNVLRDLRACQIKVKPGDVSALYIDPVTGTRTLVPLPFDQLSQYNIALCNRLDRGEISKEELKTLLDAKEREILRLKSAKDAIKAKGEVYNTCIRSANENYTKEWAVECRDRHRIVKCRLPVEVAESLDNNKRHRENICISLYGSK